MNKQWIMKKYEMDHLFNNGTAYKILYIYNLENSWFSDNSAYSFMKVHWGGL